MPQIRKPMASYLKQFANDNSARLVFERQMRLPGLENAWDGISRIWGDLLHQGKIS
jgi:hypothetical protein